MSFSRLLFLLFVPFVLFAQTQTATPAPAAAQTAEAKRAAWEAVVGFRGKPIGSNILMEIAPNGAISGWIQRNNYFPIDSGQADSEHIKFTSGGNNYDINLRTERIAYSGPDGSGNQAAKRMTYVSGMVYKIAEPMGDDSATLTLRGDEGDRQYDVGEPSIWKRSGPPIDGLEYERWKDILGKTTGLYLTKFGSARIVAVMEEPAGMDLQKHPPKDKDKKKDKKK